MNKSGEAARFALVKPESIAQIVLPGGATTTINLETNANELVFGDTIKQGTYHLRIGTNETLFCVNLLDAAESNIKPRDELQLGQHARVTATTLQRANMELWRTIAGIGLLVLLGEWWFYHKRTV
jgi:hypothetical protein